MSNVHHHAIVTPPYYYFRLRVDYSTPRTSTHSIFNEHPSFFASFVRELLKDMYGVFGGERILFDIFSVDPQTNTAIVRVPFNDAVMFRAAMTCAQANPADPNSRNKMLPKESFRVTIHRAAFSLSSLAVE